MPKGRRAPTHQRSITGELKRFDERNTGYSRADRNEITGPRHGLEQGLVKHLGKSIPGFLHEDYALTCAGRATDTLIRKEVHSRLDFDRRWNIPADRKLTGIDPQRISQEGI